MNIFKFKIVVFERKTDNNEWKFIEFIEDNNKWSLTTCGDIVSDCRFLAHYNRQNAPESVGRVYEPLFCTGLNDKNGKLEYQGDILLTPDNTICFIINDGFRWAVESPGSHAVDYEYRKFFESCEIIGNIYENKDLLYNASI